MFLRKSRVPLDELVRRLPEGSRARLDLIELKGDLTRANTKVTALNNALVSLTPLGSEFHMNPKACVDYVTRSRESMHATLKMMAKAEKKARARAILLDTTLRAAVDVIKTWFKANNDGSTGLTWETYYENAPQLQLIRDALSGTPAPYTTVHVSKLLEIEWSGRQGFGVDLSTGESVVEWLATCPSCHGIMPGQNAYLPTIAQEQHELVTGHTAGCWIHLGIEEANRCMQPEKEDS